MSLERISWFKPEKKWILPLSIAGIVVIGATAVYVISNRESTEPIPPATEAPAIRAVTALGRLEPEGEVIQLAPPPDLGGTRIGQLLVKQGDRVSAGQTIAILDNHDRATAALEVAEQDVKVARANLAIVLAGAKTGEIQAQEATIKRLQAQLQGEIAANDAEVARLQAQLQRETEERLATIDRLKAELRNAEREFQRYHQLAREGVISESELDSRRLTLDTARENLTEAQASYNKTLDTLQEQIKQAQATAQQQRESLQEQIAEATATLDSIAEVRDVDVQQAQAEVERATAALKQTEEDLKLTYVIAPTNGQVLKINAYPGELVGQDLGVVEFGQTEQMMVVAEVYESDIAKVRLGQQATITSETGAFEDKLAGTVSQIGLQIGKRDVLDTDPAADVDSRVVEVKIRLNKEDSDRVSGLTNSKVITKIHL
ncbi:ABC exporter membrane fusion protein [Pleurocapsales cyanobacterium LEGE 06147]|nr:ABC exporter membrane fusion protein [Pleurocapsales cyanobacterium LEGE 06147]